MLKKLRTKFVITNMAIVAAMLVVIFALVYQFTVMDMQRQEERMLQSMLQPEPLSQREKGKVPHLDISMHHFMIHYHSDGSIAARGLTHLDLMDDELLSQLVEEVNAKEAYTGVLAGRMLRYMYDMGPSGQRIAFLDISSQQTSLVRLAQVSFLVAVVSLGAFLVISIHLARWAVRPVEQAWQQQRQFVSDASHELKTPLTVIMSNAQMLEESQLDEENRRFTRNISLMSSHMRKVVESLLELARVDNAQGKKCFAPLDFSQLVEEAVLPFEPMFFERGLTLSCQITPNVQVNGSASYLRQAVEVLLDNAFKYGADGKVILQLRRHGRNACQLRLTTAGEPIPAEQAKKLFDRFYRIDPARSRDGSLGLGLAIAKGVVEDHRGRIFVESGAFGNCFIIQLPTI